MNKEVRIHFNKDKATYLVRLYEDNELVDWMEVIGSENLRPIIVKFYFPG